MLSLGDASNRERAAAAAVQHLPREVVRAIAKTSGETAVRLIEREVLRRAGSDVRRRRVAASGTVRFYRGTPGVAFGGSTKATTDGTKGRVLARALEFGSPGTRKVTLLWHSPKGTPFETTRHTTRGWRPEAAGGHFVTPAAEAIADQVIEEWVADVEQATIDALDKGAE